MRNDRCPCSNSIDVHIACTNFHKLLIADDSVWTQECYVSLELTVATFVFDITQTIVHFAEVLVYIKTVSLANISIHTSTLVLCIVVGSLLLEH